MIGSSKNNRENYPRKCFWTQEKETRVTFNPGLSANRPSNNWALDVIYFLRNTCKKNRKKNICLNPETVTKNNYMLIFEAVIQLGLGLSVRSANSARHYSQSLIQ